MKQEIHFTSLRGKETLWQWNTFYLVTWKGNTLWQWNTFYLVTWKGNTLWQWNTFYLITWKGNTLWQWNTFYLVTWKGNTPWQWNVANLCNIAQENFLSKNSTRNVAWKLVPERFFFFTQLSVKRNLWKSACWHIDIFWWFCCFISISYHINLFQKFHFQTKINTKRTSFRATFM